MSDEYFVMLLFPNGKPRPMMDGDDKGETVAFYTSREDAEIAAEQNPVGRAYGYEIFCMGFGE